jgi:hypothetical protein
VACAPVCGPGPSHGLTPEDATAWFEGVVISAVPTVSEAALERALAAMRSVGALPPDCYPPLGALIDGRLATLVHDLHSVKLYQRGDLLRLTMCELQVRGE